ncbi:MAG: diacylglycerol kinase [Flavobacteriaceae bacterium]|jgi:diacylglycerol kinase
MSKFFKGFAHAFRGIAITFRSELNFKVHVLALIVVVVAGCYFNISASEWTILILASMIVMGLEAVNTALEKLSNEVTEERKSSIRDIKDISAGAVLIASIGAVVIAGFIFWKYINH